MISSHNDAMIWCLICRLDSVNLLLNLFMQRQCALRITHNTLIYLTNSSEDREYKQLLVVIGNSDY